ncbi:TetR/AcrR family transcriptional regulator [Thalassospiraceae bacterium LMO-JJ14]|nr:TetR/AcrR family transcriptional regulator [Thalassospiraceae bacterium LMO-JJ14]
MHATKNAPVATDLNFGQNLIAESALHRKSARTRASICRAGCAILRERSLTALTVHDICEEAGLAHGTFYIYFSDRQAFIAELLEQFVTFVQDVMHRASQQENHDPIRAATATYCRLFAENPGMMKCLIFHLNEFPAARDAFQRLNRQWVATVVAAAARQLEKSTRAGLVSHDELVRRAYALGGMIDQYLASLYLSNDPGLSDVSGDMDQVVDTLTHIWKQSLTT